MRNKDIEAFVKPNPEAYSRFKRARFKEKAKSTFLNVQRVLKIISRVILWVCAVGGFVLSLIQFLQNQ